ncbi:MAG: HAD family hydrolase [Promethearchaeota archaeon]|nr:MAG: HAD family hydrolase [Candidatus Lokiarchaeota archaeon]
MDTPVPSLSHKNAFLFDYGDTLVKYYKGADFLPILKKALKNISGFLNDLNIPHENDEVLWKRAMQENFESKDYRVRHLADRLLRIFQLMDPTDHLLLQLQEKFMAAIRAVAMIYEDTLPTLKRIKRDLNAKIIIVSNTPWGTPSELWNKELTRFNLDISMEYIDLTVFCVDVGWRKPAPPIFQYVLDQMNVSPEECIFIGDNPTWDVQGPNQMKIDAILLDREQKFRELPIPAINKLEGLFEFI